MAKFGGPDRNSGYYDYYNYSSNRRRGPEWGKIALRVAIAGAITTALGIGGVEAYKHFVSPKIAQAKDNAHNLTEPNYPKTDEDYGFTVTPQPTDRSQEVSPTITPTPYFTPIPTETPEPTPTYAPIESTSLYDRNLHLDQDGIPTYYQLPDGSKYVFDKQEAIKLREKAIAGKEPEIVALIPIPKTEDTNDSTFSQTPKPSEHPVYTELPADVVPETELKEKYGISILQAENTQLSIRKGAFEAGNLLADYASGKYKLNIILVPGPFVSDIFLQDAKYAEIREWLYGSDEQHKPPTKAEIDIYRQQQITAAKAALDDYRRNGNVEDFILSYKHLIAEAEQLTDEEIALKLIQNWGSESYAGLYHAGKKAGENSPSYVFVAVGKKQATQEKQLIYFTSEGNIVVATSLRISSPGLDPKPDQSFPDPASFIRNPDASPEKPWTYPYGGQTPGQVLRHELGHDLLISGSQRNHSINEFTDDKGNVDYDAYIKAMLGDRSEYNTDELAMAGIAQAWELWQQQDSDKGYYFVFSLPGGKYILTKVDKAPNSI